MTTRRSFLGSILAAATPPGFVRAGVLMPVAPLIVTPPVNDLLPARLWFDPDCERHIRRLSIHQWADESRMAIIAGNQRLPLSIINRLPGARGRA